MTLVKSWGFEPNISEFIKSISISPLLKHFLQNPQNLVFKSIFEVN